jgi:hypothetical protein
VRECTVGLYLCFSGAWLSLELRSLSLSWFYGVYMWMQVALTPTPTATPTPTPTLALALALTLTLNPNPNPSPSPSPNPNSIQGLTYLVFGTSLVDSLNFEPDLPEALRRPYRRQLAAAPLHLT